MFLSGHGASGCKCDAELDAVVSATPSLFFGQERCLYYTAFLMSN